MLLGSTHNVAFVGLMPPLRLMKAQAFRPIFHQHVIQTCLELRRVLVESVFDFDVEMFHRPKYDVFSTTVAIST